MLLCFYLSITDRRSLFWISHNMRVGSPVAVLMESIFIASNLVGLSRFYIRENTLKGVEL
ncbi:YgjV family protein [Pseudoalteromonas sp.]|uniref:YgjV family protein n=1 Tax=unclassified Pseudoalteromonas TaxID=194690 RepID=UPI003F9A51A2